MIKQQNGKFSLGVHWDFERSTSVEEISSATISPETAQASAKEEFLGDIRDLENEVQQIIQEIEQDTNTAEGVTENLDKEQNRIETKENGVNGLDKFIDSTIENSEIINTAKGLFGLLGSSKYVHEALKVIGESVGEFKENGKQFIQEVKDGVNNKIAQFDAVNQLNLGLLQGGEKNVMKKIGESNEKMSAASSQKHVLTEKMGAIADQEQDYKIKSEKAKAKKTFLIFGLRGKWRLKGEAKKSEQELKILKKELEPLQKEYDKSLKLATNLISKEGANFTAIAQQNWRKVENCLKLGVTPDKIIHTDTGQMISELANIAAQGIELPSFSRQTQENILNMHYAMTHGISDLSQANAQRLGEQPQDGQDQEDQNPQPQATENPQNTQDQSTNRNQPSQEQPVAKIDKASQILNSLRAGEKFSVTTAQEQELSFERTSDGKFNAIGDPQEVKNFQGLSLDQFTDAISRGLLKSEIKTQQKPNPFDTQAQAENTANPFDQTAQSKSSESGDTSKANPEPDQSPSSEATNETKQALTIEQQKQVDQVAKQLNRPNLKQGDKIEVKVTGSDGKEIVYTLTKTTGMFNFLVSSKHKTDAKPMQNTTEFAKSLTKDIQDGAKVEVLVNPKAGSESKDQINTNLLIIDEVTLNGMPVGKQFKLLPTDPKYAKPTMFTKTPDGKFAYKASGVDGIAEVGSILSAIKGGDFQVTVEVLEGNELVFKDEVADTASEAQSETEQINPEVQKLGEISADQKAMISYRDESGEIKKVKVEYSKDGEVVLKDGDKSQTISLKDLQDKLKPAVDEKGFKVELYTDYSKHAEEAEEVVDFSPELLQKMENGQKFLAIGKDARKMENSSVVFDFTGYTKMGDGTFAYNYYDNTNYITAEELARTFTDKYSPEIAIPKNGAKNFDYNTKSAVAV